LRADFSSVIGSAFEPEVQLRILASRSLSVPTPIDRLSERVLEDLVVGAGFVVSGR